MIETAPRSSSTSEGDLGAYLSKLALIPASDIPADAIHATRRIIADTLACALAAADLDVAVALRRHRSALGGSPQSTVVGGGLLPAPAAAAVNAQIANLLDADETLHNFTHFACAVVMPALAVAESVGASGEEFVAAVATGYEIAGRFALAMPDFDLTPEGELIRMPGTGFSWAAFGAAAAAARLLSASEDRVRHALGTAFVLTPLHGSLIGFTSAMGVRPSPWYKYGAYGAIAESGVQAALLSIEGLDADPTMLVRDSGFWRAFGTVSFDWTAAGRPIEDSPWLIEQTALKPYPFCRYGHIAIDLFRQIVIDEHLSPEEIDDVSITTVPFATMQALMDYRMPASDIDVMSSLPYALAMVAHGVPAGPAWWEPERRQDSQIAKFAEKVHGVMDPTLNEVLTAQVVAGGRFRRLPTTVEVRSGARTFVKSHDRARGDTEPIEMAFTDSDLASKVRDFVGTVRGAQMADALMSAAMNIDELPDVSGLTALIGAPQ